MAHLITDGSNQYDLYIFEHNKQTEYSIKTCNICIENESIITFLPCNHKCTCRECFIEYKDNCKKKDSVLSCTICRKEIKLIKIVI